jgi:hypothetical protein
MAKKNKSQNDLIRYCYHCGARMIVTDIEQKGYDVRTGEKLKPVYHKWVCPNKKWVLDLHQSYNDIPITDSY